MEERRLAKILKESQKIVFFGGAGVSTESGIPDFRSPKGLYGEEKEKQYHYPPETILSHTFYVRHPQEFFEFYFNEMIALDAVPNAAHKALVTLEQMGKLSAVITQNIDGLHQKAGSYNVLELHGSVLKNYCSSCHEQFALEEVLKLRDSQGVPRDSKDGSIIKPDVVLYEEPLNQRVLFEAVKAIEEADCLIVAGTSLTVYPAAGLLDYFQGKYLILINKDETPYDERADLVFRKPVGQVLKEAVQELEKI